MFAKIQQKRKNELERMKRARLLTEVFRLDEILDRKKTEISELENKLQRRPDIGCLAAEWHYSLSCIQKKHKEELARVKDLFEVIKNIAEITKSKKGRTK